VPNPCIHREQTHALLVVLWASELAAPTLLIF
jgi:hypothetical protein